jgi:uncharacterized protein involved in type VI secretion and phage assembly
MAEIGNMRLSLKISGGGYEDLFPCEFVLEEGLSCVCRAELTALTTTLHPQKDLTGLLDRAVSLSVFQGLSGGLVTRCRYFHGIITGVASPGIVSSGEKTNCYRHVITIESELARLRYTRLTHPYYRKTPPDIIEEILAKYQIRGQFTDSFVNRSAYSKSLKFDQVNLSDLDFIYYLMELYGFSWINIHGPVSKNGLGNAELHFTEGNRFPQPFYEYSDKRKVPKIESFDFYSYDEKQNDWKLDGWRMENVIGVEGMEITAAYPETNFGSREWRWGKNHPGKRFHSYNSLFHGYEQRTAAAEIDGDIKKILEARRLFVLLDRERWSGRAENIGIMPGLIFELEHVYGSRDSQRLTAMVKKSRLHVRALWPTDMAALPEDAETGELTEVEFGAADWGKDSEKRFCGVPDKRVRE